MGQKAREAGRKGPARVPSRPRTFRSPAESAGGGTRRGTASEQPPETGEAGLRQDGRPRYRPARGRGAAPSNPGGTAVRLKFYPIRPRRPREDR